MKIGISLHINGHFPGEPGLAGVYWSKGRWKWWWQLDYWSYKCKAPVKSSPPTNQHPLEYNLAKLIILYWSDVNNGIECIYNEYKCSKALVLLISCWALCE